MDDADFLRAIRTDIHADAPRLIYADWLDDHGDVRADYLRLQVRLKGEWSYTNPCPEIYARLAELRESIDADWLAAVRRCTTPPPLVDVEAAIPELRGKAKTAVRLHPRRGEAAIDASKIGGTFLWPADEEWPTCTEHACPLGTMLQLCKEDVPEAEFKTGTNLFQVLWCPNGHEPHLCPGIEVYWRDRTGIAVAAARQPEPDSPDYGIAPIPCVLHFERIVEYPDFGDTLVAGCDFGRIPELSAVQQGQYRDSGSFYQCELGNSAGTKVGGHPAWVQSEEYPQCSCGCAMTLLVQFSGCEFDTGSWNRWQPIEDRNLTSPDWRVREAISSAPGWEFGDSGRLYLFTCPKCPSRPVRWLVQGC